MGADKQGGINGKAVCEMVLRARVDQRLGAWVCDGVRAERADRNGQKAAEARKDQPDARHDVDLGSA